MSYGCMYILRGAVSVKELKQNLISMAHSAKCGVCFNPVNNLLIESSIHINKNDLVFEVCDSFASSDASLLLSYDNISHNGRFPKLSLSNRMIILQEYVIACLPYVEKLEMFLGEDSPLASDYIDLCISVNEAPRIATKLVEAYRREAPSAFIPCLHVTVAH